MAETKAPPVPLSKSVIGARMAEQVREGTVSLAQLMQALAPSPRQQDVPAAPPAPVVELTGEQLAALRKLPAIYGQVVVAERRALTTEEVTTLLEERGVLDTIAKMAETRKETIRANVYSHFDVEAEAAGITAPRDSRGYLVTEAKAVSGSGQRAFKRTLVHNSPSVDTQALRALEATGDLPHDLWLKITRQERVFDENLFMAALRANPELISVLEQVTRPGTVTTQLRIAKP